MDKDDWINSHESELAVEFIQQSEEKIITQFNVFCKQAYEGSIQEDE